MQMKDVDISPAYTHRYFSQKSEHTISCLRYIVGCQFNGHSALSDNVAYSVLYRPTLIKSLFGRAEWDKTAVFNAARNRRLAANLLT